MAEFFPDPTNIDKKKTKRVTIDLDHKWVELASEIAGDTDIPRLKSQSQAIHHMVVSGFLAFMEDYVGNPQWKAQFAAQARIERLKGQIESEEIRRQRDEELVTNYHVFSCKAVEEEDWARVMRQVEYGRELLPLLANPLHIRQAQRTMWTVYHKLPKEHRNLTPEQEQMYFSEIPKAKGERED